MICENFLSETRAGSNDMPLQLQFDFRFRRALKEHLKQMCRTKFCYYTNAKSHYPRVESVFISYSEPHVAKMSPLSSAQLTKSRQKWETTWPIKHGQSVAQKAVRNMSTKDNPGTLPMNICLTEQPTSQWDRKGPRRNDRNSSYCKKGEGTKGGVKWSCTVVWWQCLSCVWCFISPKKQGQCALMPMCSIR